MCGVGLRVVCRVLMILRNYFTKGVLLLSLYDIVERTEVMEYHTMAETRSHVTRRVWEADIFIHRIVDRRRGNPATENSQCEQMESSTFSKDLKVPMTLDGAAKLLAGDKEENSNRPIGGLLRKPHS